MNIGERIREARNAKSLTQKQLGDLSGTSEITIRQYELGKRQPRLKQLSRIALALNISVSELVEPGYWDTLTPEDEENMWGPSGQQRVVTALKQMTQAGVEKVADYAEDILPRYKKEAPKQGGE